MSTGDDSLFIRGRLSDRGTIQRGHFMKDGFDEWAESERPARLGGAEKEPAEKEMRRVGGATQSIEHLLGHKHHRRVGGAVKDDIDAGIKYFKEDISKWQLWKLVPASIKDFVAKAIELYETLKSQAPAIKSALEMYGSSGVSVPLQAKSKQVLGAITKLGFGAPQMKKIAKHLKHIEEAMSEHAGEDGVHFIRGLHKLHLGRTKKGGDAFDDKLDSITGAKTAVNAVSGYNATAKKVVEGLRGAYNIYDSVKKASPEIKSALRDYAPAAADKVIPIMEKVGLGRRGSKKWIQEAVKGMKKGAFTKQALRHDELPEEYAEEVLEHPQHHTLKTRRRAQFVENIQPKEGGFSLEEAKAIAKKYAPSAVKLAKEYAKVGKGKGKSARGEIVKKVMREKGLSLPEASKYVKEHGLY